MADDPYNVLGVARTASEDEIRSAYRKLAKEMHPDLNPENRAEAEERFKRVSAAYEIVGDAEKRRRFDRGEIDAAGEARRPRYQNARAGRGAANPFADRAGSGHPFDDADVGGIFSDLFGRRGRGPGGGLRGQDQRYSLEIDLLEAVAGARKRVTMPDGGTLDLSVPEGVSDGQVLRLKGKGTPGFHGGEPGDALVEIKVRPHLHFRRAGDDLLIEVPITLDEAILGARVEVPTAAGRVALTIPKGTSSGRVFRLKGKGVRNMATGKVGDQLVSVRIELPASIDEQLSYFIQEWRQKNAYDPGRP
jgi:DnaJ-class molecular chaperone